MIGASVTPTGHPACASVPSAATRAATGSVPPSKRDHGLSENRSRVRPWWGRSSRGATSANFVVARSCTGPGNSWVPTWRIAAARLPVAGSIPSGSV